MTMFYLIRHGFTDAVGKQLVGWMPGIHLNEIGRTQVAGLAERFRSVPLTAVYASPLERTRQTAEALAMPLDLNIQFAEEIGEVHYGEWTGRTAEDLLADPGWLEYNSSRSSYRIPGGETAVEVQSRMVGFLKAVRDQSPEGHVAIVSHGDPIKTAVMYYVGMSLDLFQRIEISPASVTIICDDPSRTRVMAINTLDGTLARYLDFL